MRKVRVTFQVEPELEVKIKKVATKRGVSVSTWLRLIVLDWFATGKTPSP